MWPQQTLGGREIWVKVEMMKGWCGGIKDTALKDSGFHSDEGDKSYMAIFTRAEA